MIIPVPFCRYKLCKLAPFNFIFLPMKGIFMDERNPCTTYTWFSYSPIQNTWRIFGSAIVFLEVRGHFIPGEKCIIYVGPRWRNGRWRNWRRKWMDFSVFLIVVHRFYILHSAFCILYLTFCILYLISDILYLTFCILHLT